MPVRDEHHYFCQRWNILPHRNSTGCPLDLYQQWDKPDTNCPLDGLRRANGEWWHDFHGVKRVLGKDCYSKIERPPQIDGRVTWPQIEGCVAWVQEALDRREPFYDEFTSRLTKVPREEVRFCWKAHLVADFGCLCCCSALGRWKKKKEDGKYEQYREMKRDHPDLWDQICDYVTNIYHSIKCD